MQILPAKLKATAIITSLLNVFVSVIYSGIVFTHIFNVLAASLTDGDLVIKSFASANEECTASAHPSDECSAALVTCTK